MELVFATNNRNKALEINEILGDQFSVKTLKDIGCEVDIPENELTLEGNAVAKAKYVVEHYGLPCFADDTGLEIAALNGEPGVYSARYAGTEKDAEANMDKVLNNLQGKENRSAQFRTVIALMLDGETHLFEGVVKGFILMERHGKEGFGYDPIFQPDGHDESFAEMTMEAKNAISHRGRAVRKLVDFLTNRS